MEENIFHNLEPHCSTHNQHLCYLVSQGFDRTDPDEYLSLVSEPVFQCANCKRLANHGDHLCRPIDIWIAVMWKHPDLTSNSKIYRLLQSQKRHIASFNRSLLHNDLLLPASFRSGYHRYPYGREPRVPKARQLLYMKYPFSRGEFKWIIYNGEWITGDY